MASAFDPPFARHGPSPGEDDEVYAVDVHGVFVQLFSRINALLDRAEFIDNPADKIDAHNTGPTGAGKTCGIDWRAKKEEIRA